MFNNLNEHLKPVSQLMTKHKPAVGHTIEYVADSLNLQNNSRPGTAVDWWSEWQLSDVTCTGSIFFV